MNKNQLSNKHQKVDINYIILVRNYHPNNLSSYRNVRQILQLALSS